MTAKQQTDRYVSRPMAGISTATMLRPMPRRLTIPLLAIALVLTACSTADDPSSPGLPSSPATPTAAPPTGTPSEPSGPDPSATPSAAPVIDWQAATVPETVNGSGLAAVVPGGDGLVAVGYNGSFGSILWTSADGGRTWTDITPAEFASVGIASVVEHDGRLIGVGRGDTIDIETEQAAVYVSDDGRAWRKVSTDLGQLIDVVATEDGLFAVGGVPGADSAGVWRSTDGEEWERVGGDFEHAFLWTIAEGGPGLVAAGWRRNPDPDLAVWTSSDLGETWELAPDPEGFAGHEATDVAAIGDRLVMVGSAFDGSGGRAWTSADGVAWEIADVEMGGAYARSVAVSPAGLVAVGGGEGMEARSWLTPDGVTWQTLGDPVPGAYFHGVTVTDAGLVALGATQAGTIETGIQASAAVWLANLDD